MLYTLFITFNMHCNLPVFDLANLFIRLNISGRNKKSYYRNISLFPINPFTFITLFTIF